VKPLHYIPAVVKSRMDDIHLLKVALANGASATVTVVITTTADGIITNEASVTANEPESDQENNETTEDTIVGEGDTADLEVTKSDDNDPVSLGDEVTYTVIVTDNGPSEATDVTLTDTLPAGVIFVSAAPSQGSSCTLAEGIVTCNLGDLANGATATVTIIVTTPAEGVISNTASVAATGPDSDMENNETTEDTIVGEGEEEKRKGFVGQVQGKPGDSVTIIQQGKGTEIAIILPETYKLKTPGGPRAGTFEDGARVAILARLVGDNWVAIRVLVKPVKPPHPLQGTVTEVQGSEVTVLLHNGETMTINLPPNVEPPEEGDVITLLWGRSSKAKGLVRADEVRRRLQRHVDEATDDGDENDGEDFQTRSKRFEKLSQLLENHQSRHIERLESNLTHASEKAKAAIQRAKDKATNGQQRAHDAVEKARDKVNRAKGLLRGQSGSSEA